MKKIVYFIFLVSFIISCTKENTDEEINMISSGTDICSLIDISYLNTKGEDLLNPATDGYFSFEDMKLYYVKKNGDKEEVYHGNYDNPRNISLFNEIEPFKLRIFTDTDTDNMISEDDSIMTGQSINILELNENISDTIIAEWNYYKWCGSFDVIKFWYNGTLYEKGDIVTDTIKNK